MKESKWIDLATNGDLRELTQAHQAALLQNVRNRRADGKNSSEQVTKNGLDPAFQRVKKPRPPHTKGKEDAESRSESDVSLALKKKKKKHRYRPTEEDSESRPMHASNGVLDLGSEISDSDSRPMHKPATLKKKKKGEKMPKHIEESADPVLPNSSPSVIDMPPDSNHTGPASKKKRKSDTNSTAEPRPRPTDESADLMLPNSSPSAIDMPPDTNRTGPARKKKRKSDTNPTAEPRSTEGSADPVLPNTSHSIIDMSHDSKLTGPSPKKKKKSDKNSTAEPRSTEESAGPVLPNTSHSIIDMSHDSNLTGPSSKKKKKSDKSPTDRPKPTEESVDPMLLNTSQSVLTLDMTTESGPSSVLKSAPKKKETGGKKPTAKVARPRVKATNPKSSSRPIDEKKLRLRVSRAHSVPRLNTTYTLPRYKIPALVARARDLLEKWKEPIPPKGSAELVYRKLRMMCSKSIQTSSISNMYPIRPSNLAYVLMELRKCLIRHDWPGAKKVLKILLRVNEMDRLQWKILVTIYMYYPGVESLFQEFIEENKFAYSSRDVLKALLTINGMTRIAPLPKIPLSRPVL